MVREDNILFSEYFYLRKDTKISNLYDTILNILLNSKELTDTPLRISNKGVSTQILGLIVTPFSSNSYDSRFSLIYSVSDEDVHENRTMDGYIKIQNNTIELVSEISRFNESGFISSSELVEVIHVNSEGYTRYYNYGGTCFSDIEYINNKEFERVSEFKTKTVKLIRERNK